MSPLALVAVTYLIILGGCKAAIWLDDEQETNR